MTAIFSPINGQKRSRLPAAVGSVIFMLILSLSLNWPGFIQAQTDKIPPDEQKVVEWLAELSAATKDKKRTQWRRKMILGLKAGPNPMLVLYERGNLLAGLYVEVEHLSIASYVDGASEESDKWAAINKANNLEQLLARPAEDNVQAMRLMMMISGGMAGHERNVAEVRQWTKKMAEAGDPTSQHSLGFWDWDIDSNDVEGRKEVEYWRSRLYESSDPAYFASAGGHYKCQGDRAAWTPSGKGQVDQADNPDFVEAVRWFRKGADLGSARAQAELAGMYEKGYGVPLDYDQAKRWYALAAENGDEDSRLHFNLYYAHGQPGPQKDHAETLDYYRRKAESGDAESQYVLGTAYSGLYEGFPENKPEAAKWLAKAYEAGVPRAAYILGVMYHKEAAPYSAGGDNESKKMAREWLTKAAEAGESEAMTMLTMSWYRKRPPEVGGETAAPDNRGREPQ